MQMGFDFPTEAFGADYSRAAGAWLPIARTAVEFQQALATARAALPSLDGPLRLIFERTICAAESSVHEFSAYREQGEPFAWFCRAAALTPSGLRVVAAACAELGRGDRVAVHSNESVCDTWAIYADGVGTLVVRQWQHEIGATFTPARAPELLPSYSDDAPRYALPQEVWYPSNCGQALAEANEVTPAVHPFDHNGRRWVVAGCVHSRGQARGHGWAVVAGCDWQGPTYSYADLLRAGDAGRIERGDLRGLRVSVQGTPCVLASAASFQGRASALNSF